jgi:hypothetical protein
MLVCAPYLVHVTYETICVTGFHMCNRPVRVLLGEWWPTQQSWLMTPVQAISRVYLRGYFIVARVHLQGKKQEYLEILVCQHNVVQDVKEGNKP